MTDSRLRAWTKPNSRRLPEPRTSLRGGQRDRNEKRAGAPTPTRRQNPTLRKEMTIMSNTITAEQVSINAWCEQVRQIHADATRPMQDDDARLVELYLTDPAMWTPERLEAAGFGPSDLGELYFTKVSTLPAFPAPAPEWAVTAEFLLGTYPEVVICYYGQEWTQGDFTARIMQSDTVFVEDTGEGFRVSDLLTGTPTIDASPISTDMTLEQAMNASIALEDAVHEFARRVEVTE